MEPYFWRKNNFSSLNISWHGLFLSLGINLDSFRSILVFLIIWKTELHSIKNPRNGLSSEIMSQLFYDESFLQRILTLYFLSGNCTLLRRFQIITDKATKIHLFLDLCTNFSKHLIVVFFVFISKIHYYTNILIGFHFPIIRACRQFVNIFWIIL